MLKFIPTFLAISIIISCQKENITLTSDPPYGTFELEEITGDSKDSMAGLVSSANQ